LSGSSDRAYIITYKDSSNEYHTLSGSWTITSPILTSYTKNNITGNTFTVSAGTFGNDMRLSVFYSEAEENTYIPKNSIGGILSGDQYKKYRISSDMAYNQTNSNAITGYYPNFYGFKVETEIP